MAFDFEKARAGFGLERAPAENVALEIQEFRVDGADPRLHVAIGKSLATGAEMATRSRRTSGQRSASTRDRRSRT